MSRKGLIPAHRLHNDQSLAASFESTAVTLTTANRVAFNIATASVTDNTGTFQVQHRIWNKDQQTGSEWATLTLSTTPTLADTDAQFLVDVEVPPGQVRVKFTAAGGTPDGTCDIWVSGCGGD